VRRSRRANAAGRPYAAPVKAAIAHRFQYFEIFGNRARSYV
jgi:hypothetical protein